MGFHQKLVGTAAVLCVALVFCVAGAVFADGPTIRAVDQPAGETQLLVQHFVPPTDKAGGGSLDCEALANNPGIEPATFAAECGYWKTSVIGGTNTELGPTDLGYAQDIGFVSDNFVSFQLGDFPGQTVVGQQTDAYYGMDFDPGATTLWALNDTSGTLGTIDLASGAYTPVVACPGPGGGTWSGLTIDSLGGFWGSTVDSLYTIDPGTGASTLVGAFGTTGALVIDIAVNATGDMYLHDIGDDSIYSVNTATGAATLIGLTGYNANYAQGMDFDAIDGTLYIALYEGGGANVYGTVDLATGAVTALATSNPEGEFEMAAQTAAGDFEPLRCNGATVSFEDGDFIPDDWSITTNADPGGEWLVSTDNSSTYFAIPATPAGTRYASANDDAAGSGSDGSADYLYSNIIDLSTASAASMDFLFFFTGVYGQIAGGVEVSGDGGATWDGEIIVPTVSDWAGYNLDLSAYAGNDNVQVRFHSDDGGDWATGFAVDGISLACTQPAITMVKTVGTVDGVCATTDTIVVPPGTDVYYCYTVTNTGNTALGLHDLVDDQLGTILDDLAYDLQPGASVEVLLNAVNIATTTVNTATWTAFNPDPVEADEAEATDDATVVVLENDTCDDAIELTCPAGGGTFSVLGSTLLASYTGPFFCDTDHTAPELWYKIMGNGGGITATTCSANTNYDTKLSSFDGTCGALGCVIGDDDDFDCSFSSLQTTINWTSVLDTEYYIMVHGYSSGVGDFELTITCDIPVELQSFTIE